MTEMLLVQTEWCCYTGWPLEANCNWLSNIQEQLARVTTDWQWSVYRKNSKIWDTSNNCHNCPKNRKVCCNIALMHPKEADAMANSIDPDQTASSEAVWSWSALFAETYLSQYIEFLWYFLFVSDYFFHYVYDFCLPQKAMSLCKWFTKVVVCLEKELKFQIQIHSDHLNLYCHILLLMENLQNWHVCQGFQ